jgi:circadian clock protein KaiC
MFVFDESPQTLLTRCGALGIDLEGPLAAGTASVNQVDPVEFTPGELVDRIRSEVERGAKVVVIDSLNGYLNAMPEERFLIVQLHELLMYLSQHSVATLLIAANQGMIGAQMPTPVDASYLADAVLMLRYFELGGEVRQALSVVKKRGGAHERTIREFSLGAGGITVGEPLRQFRGVLTGVPIFDPSPLPDR